MTRYSVQSKEFVRDYRFCFLTENMCKLIGKNISKKVCTKYSQKIRYDVKIR